MAFVVESTRASRGFREKEGILNASRAHWRTTGEKVGTWKIWERSIGNLGDGEVISSGN
jgi:hypothetical protein